MVRAQDIRQTNAEYQVVVGRGVEQNEKGSGIMFISEQLIKVVYRV